MKFANMKIGVRLGLGFGVVLALMLAMAGAGVLKMSQLNGGLEGIVNDNDVQIKAIMEMRHNVMSTGQAVRNMALMGEADQMSDELDRINDDRDEYNANTEILQRLASGNGKELLERIAAARAAADPVTDQVIALLKQGKGPDAVALLAGQGRATQKKWIATLDEMVRVQEKRADSAVEAAHSGYRLALIVALAISAVAMVLGVGTGSPRGQGRSVGRGGRARQRRSGPAHASPQGHARQPGRDRHRSAQGYRHDCQRLA